MPQLSIIVPVYNVEKFIHRCIGSILAQTFSDFELILVDDGSPDRCGDICEEYAAKDSRIRVIHKPNGCLSSARNAGLEIAGGKYILFCDSDDYVAPNWCDQFLQKVSPSEDNYIFGGINTVKVSETGETVISPAPLVKTHWEISDYLALQSHGILGFAWNVLYYASVLQTNHLRFSETVIVEDLPFNLAYLRHMKSLTHTEDAGYYYIQDCRETLSRKYYPEAFRKWQEKYRVTQDFIDEVLPTNVQAENRRIAAGKYLYLFLQSLNNTFDPRNPKTLPEKLRYNIRVVQSPEFQHCLQHADAANEDPRVIRLLKKKKYLTVFSLQKASQLKRYVLERSKSL